MINVILVLPGLLYHCSIMYRVFTSGIIAFIFLLSGTEVHQLFRITKLISHYNHHREENPHMDIWEFLRLHYSDEHPGDNDEQEDEKLPFKSAACVSHIDQVLAKPGLPEILSSRPSSVLFILEITRGKPCGEVSGIFRPPRPV